jgi:hypothetical protein
MNGSAYPSTLATSRNSQQVFVTGATNAIEGWPVGVPGYSADLMTVAYAA